MVKQSKNKVKLNKKYKVIGRIPIAAIRKIKEVMELPGNVQTIRANIENTLKHNKKHIKGIVLDNLWSVVALVHCGVHRSLE